MSLNTLNKMLTLKVNLPTQATPLTRDFYIPLPI